MAADVPSAQLRYITHELREQNRSYQLLEGLIPEFRWNANALIRPIELEL